MIRRSAHRRAARAAIVVMCGLLAGCAGPTQQGPSGAPVAAPAASTVAAAPLAPLAPPTPGSPEAAACATTPTTISTVRGIADALQRGPVVPAGVALLLITPRERAVAPQVSEPQLRAARAEMVSAIDELDAQGQAMLPPGGDALHDPVQLDPARILAAAAELERLCGKT